MKICEQVRHFDLLLIASPQLYVYGDPKHFRDISGCTAVAALVTHEDEIYVVCALLLHDFTRCLR
jgi:hypothetical protein